MPNAVSPRRIHGSCHCGNIRFRLDWPDPQPTIPARACGCGHCVRHRGVWTSNPRGSFQLEVAEPGRVRQYQFGTRTADFHVCTSCGVVPIVTWTADGNRYAVFNVNTFDDVDRSELVEAPTDFEGETAESRLARRRRNWTPEAA